MNFPGSIVVAGATAVAAAAIYVCGRALIAAVERISDAHLDAKARVQIGIFALVGILVILAAALAAMSLTESDQPQAGENPQLRRIPD